VGYHVFPQWIPGGFVGVDVFFVISGFLISNILFAHLRNGRLGLTEFYARRAKRILPALVIVLLGTLVLGWLVLLPHEYSAVGRHVAASTAFVQNVTLWHESGYFDTAIERKPLVHLWSLGVEEQFYLAWPMLLWAVWRTRRRAWILMAVAVTSFAVGVAALQVDAAGAYYLPQYRLWELMAGALLAYGGQERTRRLQLAQSAAAMGATSMLGAGMIIGTAMLIDKSWPFPGWLALGPVVGGVLMIAAGPGAWINKRVLSASILVAVGRISYPLYLWHWPLFSLALFVQPDLSMGLRWGVVMTSLVLAWLTYALVEKPIRPAALRPGVIAPVLLAVVTIGGVGYWIHARQGFPARLERFNYLASAVKEPQHFPGSMQALQIAGQRFYFQSSGRRETTLFIGDSNMEQYYARLEHLLKLHGAQVNSIAFRTTAGCVPLPDLKLLGVPADCSDMMADGLRLALARKEIDTVVIAGQWNGYLVDGASLPRTYRYGDFTYQRAMHAFSAYLTQLVQGGKRVFVVLNIPAGRDLDPASMVQRDLMRFPDVFHVNTSGKRRSELEARYGALQSDIEHAAVAAGAMVIRPLEHLCGPVYCASVDAKGAPIYADRAHLRSAYVREHVEYLDATLR
jgi:peptidoglycan/LPS O-acetylase OafA/YrhL